MSGKINYPLLILSVMIISVVILSTALLNSNLFETNGNSGLSNNNSPAGSDFSRIYIDTLNPSIPLVMNLLYPGIQHLEKEMKYGFFYLGIRLFPYLKTVPKRTQSR